MDNDRIRATDVNKDALRKATKGKLDLPRPADDIVAERIDLDEIEIEKDARAT